MVKISSFYYVIFIILFLSPAITCSLKIEKSRLYIDEKSHIKTELTIKIEKVSKDIYSFEEGFLPSELVSLLPDEAEFSLQVIQGRLTDQGNLKSSFIPFEISAFNNFISDYPSGYIYQSKNLSPFDNIKDFKNYFDIFSYVFKITFTPLNDRSGYVIVNDTKILIDDSEKPCNEHLDAIKNVLPKSRQSEFESGVNYDLFTKSDYKTINYHVKSTKGYVEYSFEIIYHVDEKVASKLKDVSSLTIGDDVTSNRYIQGTMFNFENLVFHHDVALNEETAKKIHGKTSTLTIIEMIPRQIQPLYSTLSVSLFRNNTLVKKVSVEEMKDYFEVIINEKTEDQHPEIPFTFDDKTTTQLNIKVKPNAAKYLFNRIEIQMEIRKLLLNFEAVDNLIEFGAVFPCGVIVLDNKFTVTNWVYYNFPAIDETMPFNIISLCWVVYGFMLVQILGIFLGQGQKTLFERIKDFLNSIKERFMAKWGIFFGR